MNIAPRLVVDYGNFIIVNSKVLVLLHNNSSGFNDNPMHAFSHLPANGVKLMFTWNILHLQNIKEFFHTLKICQRPTKFQEPKDGHNLNELLLLFINFTKISHHFNNNILTHSRSVLAW
jgi:hypothetical protein